MKQWKRLAALSSAIVMAAATLTYFPNDTLQNIRLELSASAGTTTEPQVWNEDNLTWKLDADGTLTISGTGAMKDYNAAENLSPAYMNSDVKKVVIEDGVTSIGELAFFKCSSLTNITIPDSVTCIAYAAFHGCSSLSSITIPNSVTSIGIYAFVVCSSLTSITIPDGVTSIGYGAFSDCSSLKTISLSCKSSLKKSDFGDQANLVSYTNQHLLTKTAAKAATCTESGNKEYWTCKHCGKYFLSDDTNPATATAVELSETVIPALNHKNATTRGAFEPTETEPGYSGDRYCPDCDTVFEKGYTYWNESNLTWKLDADGTLTISGTGAMKNYDYDNPSPVCNNSNVKKVVIEDGVTSIGNWAFESCSSLTSITIPNSVTSIGAYAFSNCYYLTNITIPNSVTSIENYAFRACSSLTSITIPDSVTSIGELAFYDCDRLTSITISNSVTSIGERAFAYCSSLTSITIPDSVTSIGEAAFAGCSSLTSITIPDSVTSIGEYAFQSCSSLTSITIPDSVTSIGWYAFSNCESLTSITIPDSVTSIGSRAFSECYILKTISLSCKSSLKRSDFGDKADLVSYTLHTLKKTAAKAKTCTEDGNKEYWTCEHCGKYFLSDDTNPETAKAVEQSEFIIPASHKLTKVEAKAPTCTEDGNKEYWTCEHCGKYFLSDDANPATATAVELSETVIPALNHKNATTRGAVEPNGTKPGYSGDRYCPDCDTVFEKGYTYWNEDNLTWKLDADGTLTISGTGAMKNYDYYDNPSPVYNNSNVKKVVIEDGVTSIGNSAFDSCIRLTSITIPDSVTSIGNAAFYGCSSLTSITIPDGVTSIGNSAFFGCSSLTSVTIPGSVTSIGNSAFDSCSSLTSITIPDGVTSIGNSAFSNCSSLTSITIPGSVTSIGNSAFDSCIRLTSITIPDSVTSIGNFAFNGCVSLTSITIPSSVTSIGNYAFQSCSSLTSITIPSSVTSIGKSAFYKCSSLTSITIPDSVTSIGNSVFSDCGSLTTISLSCGSALKKSDFGKQADLVSYTNQHLLTKTAAKAPTCTEDGNKEYWTCEHCGKYFLSDDTNPETAKAVEQSEFIIPASHKLTKVEAKDATCSESGNKAYWTCEHCGKYFLSDDTNPATAKAVELSETVIPALNHKNAITSYGASKPTETAPGYSGDLYCPDCDTVLEKGYTYWNEGNLTWKLDADGTLTISGTGAMKDYDIENNKSPVFKNSNVKKVVIEDGVTSIGAYAFYNCISLTDITIPDSVTSIGYAALAGCVNLTSITIPKNVTSIGNSAFYGCGLTSITIPKNVTSIGDSVFESCPNLTDITIPDSVTSIGNSAFNSCISLTSIMIPDSVTSIGEWAFSACISLTSIMIPDSVISIGDSAFYYCTSLTSITIPKNVTSIGKSAFGYCNSLTSVTIPDSVTSIGESVFDNCSSLKTISLSCGSALKRSDFGKQADLVSYTNQHTLTKTEAKAATCTEDGNKEYWTCEHCGKYFLSDDTNPETAKAVELSETVIPASHKLTKVEAKAPTCTEDGNKEYWTCEHCKKYFLSNDTNPETAKAVELSETILPAIQHKNAELRNASEPTETAPGYSGDRYCPDCDKVVEKGYTYWNEGNLTWKLYADGKLTISGTGAMKDYDIEDNESPVFKNLNVKKIVIEDGVTNIGNYAFDCCTGLTSITIPDSVTSIGDYALQSCTNLTSITIPDSVTSIGAHAFSNCYKLISITLPSSITSIGEWLFAGCGDLTSITIPDSVTSIGDYAFYYCYQLTSITLSSSITRIGDDAFGCCSNLKSITIPDSVTSIGNSAFDNCSSLKTISLGCGSALKRSDFGKQGDLVSYTNQHLLTKTAAKAKTCTEDGNKEYWTCEHCGKYFLSDDANPETAKAVEQAETVIPASHKLTKVEAKAATCTEDGNKEYWTCEHCKKYFLSDDTNPETAKAVEQSETVIPASHKLTKVEAKAATYAENGNKEYWTCKHCGKYFLSDDTNPETAKAVELSETVIPALVQVATATTPIKCVYGQDMNKIDLRDYVKNTDVVGEVTVKVATGSTLPDGMKLDGSNLSGKPAKAYEDGKEVTFTFTAENGSTANLTLLFLVAKADPTVEVAVSGDSHTEGDLVGELELILSENSTKGVVELVSEIKALVAGKNTFTWKFTPEDENNYHTVTGTVVVNAQTTTTTTTTKATTTTKTTTTKATTTTKPNKTTTTKATTTTKPNKTTTTKATTTTKPSKTTTTNATTTTKPSKTTTTNATTTTKPSKTTTTNVTTTTKPSKTTTTNATTTTKPSKTTTTNATTTTKPSKTTTTNATTTNTAIPSYGDVNLDGKVDILDAVFLNKYLATLIQFSDAQIANADCYQDGVLNDQDTTALMQFIILLIDDLPAQPTEK